MQIGVQIDDVIIAGGVHLLLTNNPLFNSDLVTLCTSQDLKFTENYDAIVCCSAYFEKLKLTNQHTKLVLILPNHSTDDIESIIRSEVGAILTEKEVGTVLPIAVQCVTEKTRYFSPEITLSLINHSSLLDKKLTERELEIAYLISQGLKSSEISEKLFLSVSTVATHRKHIFKKLNIHSAKELTKLIQQ